MKNDARETYQAKANDIARLIDVLQMELDKHADAAKADERCWGKVGDLGTELFGVVSTLDRGEPHVADGGPRVDDRPVAGSFAGPKLGLDELERPLAGAEICAAHLRVEVGRRHERGAERVRVVLAPWTEVW